MATPQAMMDGTGNFVLLAVPFFIFAGLINGTWLHQPAAGAFAMSLVGRMRGGGALGISAVQHGIVLTLAMGVGAFLPPIGVGFYVSAAVAGSDIESAARTMIPYAVVLVLAVLLVAFVPEITLLVPRLLDDSR